jgi:hypothetical protein
MERIGWEKVPSLQGEGVEKKEGQDGQLVAERKAGG